MPSSIDEARFWDRVARKYERDRIKDMAGYQRTLERTRQLLGAGDTVLEIGCGTGTTALHLAPALKRLFATDVSSEMIAIAREKAAAAACTNVEFMVAAAGMVPGDDGSCDAVLALNLLHLVVDRRAALERSLRLLKPGGLLISKTPCLAEMSWFIRLAVPLAQRLGKAPPVSVFSAPQLEADIEAVGFTIIERGRHGSKRGDPRIFLVARKSMG